MGHTPRQAAVQTNTYKQIQTSTKGAATIRIGIREYGNLKVLLFALAAGMV